MTLTWLASELRNAGLVVVEHSGWQTHVRPGSWDPRYGVVHATAAPRTQSDATQVRIVRDGRSDLPGPIANACVDRQGRWHVLSAGRCNSTLTGTAGPYEGLGNTYALSTEACNDNIAEPWPDVQYRSYVRGWAAWCRRLGWTASRLVGHKEHTPGRKTDPTFSMSQFRADVAAVLAGEDNNVSAQDVVDGLRTTGPWASESVGRAMTAAGVGQVSQRVLGEYTWADVRAIRTEQTAAKLRDQAILAAVKGLDTTAVLARIDEHAKAEAARDAADAQRDAELRALVERIDSGAATAAEVAEQLRALVHAATAPAAQG